jgi:hypothetical protein
VAGRYNGGCCIGVFPRDSAEVDWAKPNGLLEGKVLSFTTFGTVAQAGELNRSKLKIPGAINHELRNELNGMMVFLTQYLLMVSH